MQKRFILTLTALLTACTPSDFRPAAPDALSVKQSASATLAVQVERDEGQKGPIAVTLAGLPNGVTASPATIPEGQTRAILTVKADTTAPLTTAPVQTPITGTHADGPTLQFTAGDKTHTQPLTLTVLPQSGSTDRAFGKGGTITFKMGVHLKRDHANTLAQDAKGRILVGGQKDGHFAVYRLLPSGQPDSTFGKGGLAVAPAATGTMETLIVNADGSLLAVGGDMYELGNIILARFTASGTLDKTFGKNGTVSHAFPNFEYYGVWDAEQQPDGKTVIAGRLGNEPGGSGGLTDARPFLARFNPNGTPDRSFGNGGRVIGGPQTHGAAADVEMGPNDTLVVVGNAQERWGENWSDNIFYLARYRSDGSPDTTFGNNGFVTYTERGEPSSQSSADVYGRGVSVQADGRVLTVANVYEQNTESYMTRTRVRVAQYLPDGARDQTFGENGALTFDFGYSATVNELIQAPDGYYLNGMVTPEEASAQSASLIKLTKDGQLDERFNFDGRVGMGTLSNPLNVVVQRDGRVLTGTSLSPFFQDWDDNDDAAKVNVEIVRIHP